MVTMCIIQRIFISYSFFPVTLFSNFIEVQLTQVICVFISGVQHDDLIFVYIGK